MKRIKNAKWGKNNQCTDTPPLQFYLYIDKSQWRSWHLAEYWWNLLTETSYRLSLLATARRVIGSTAVTNRQLPDRYLNFRETGHMALRMALISLPLCILAHKCCACVNEAVSQISNCCHYICIIFVVIIRHEYWPWVFQFARWEPCVKCA